MLGSIFGGNLETLNFILLTRTTRKGHFKSSGEYISNVDVAAVEQTIFQFQETRCFGITLTTDDPDKKNNFAKLTDVAVCANFFAYKLADTWCIPS